MDVKALKEEALKETARRFSEKQGVLPDPDSEEWEEEYRRQFELAKKRQGGKPPGATASAAPALVSEQPDELPQLTGSPADQRWAATIRAERVTQIHDKAMRD